jgi:hypothetical protein
LLFEHAALWKAANFRHPCPHDYHENTSNGALVVFGGYEAVHSREEDIFERSTNGLFTREHVSGAQLLSGHEAGSEGINTTTLSPYRALTTPIHDS